MSSEPLLIVTGLSGAGKTEAMKALEDLGYFCIDNLPPSLLTQLSQLPALTADSRERIAIAMDVRGRSMFTDLFAALDVLRSDGVLHKILFLDCADDLLVRRYSETRRRHPVREGHSLYEQIAAERRLLSKVRERADLVLDTTRINPRELKIRLGRLVLNQEVSIGIDIDVMSFGFKHGVPLDADLMFDVRFLPNPYYDTELRPLTGLDKPVADYIFLQPETNLFIDEICPLIERWIPLHAASGKARLTIALGCTGGQHRSVAIAECVSKRLIKHFTHVLPFHRDLQKKL
jgi:UPF0042 nucleotide-binding protein|tara:strand:+ start:142 stop:1011 length:870 start_codon:yes stop_codon:yes gene_type:complete